MSSEELRDVLKSIADRAVAFRESRAEALHRPLNTYAEAQNAFDAPVPERGVSIHALIEELAALSEPGLANMVGPRFFGWVIGATSPAGVAADWLTSAWGQNVGNAHATPAASACEEQTGKWLLELLDLPRESSVGFVSGATIANFTCLAAARGEVLRRAGWDVEADGLFGAPPVHVVLGEEAHSTVFSGLRYLGLGAKRVVSVPVTEQGLMK
ncbi:MAG: pyridoxal-dependent decarboxylase, partial [Hyphomonadaceae bacterium]